MKLSVRSYKKTECITFKSTKGKYGALSNMAPGFPLLIDGHFIRTSEALYQSLRFPDYPEIQKKIVSYPSPISAKEFARTQIEKTRTDWEVNRFKIMRFCIELKLFQNKEEFSKALLSTHDLAIVEYTAKDKIWGATDEGSFYTGTNALGRLLMELREKIKTNQFELQIPNLENLKFLNTIITMENLSSTSQLPLPAHHPSSPLKNAPAR